MDEDDAREWSYHVLLVGMIEEEECRNACLLARLGDKRVAKDVRGWQDVADARV